MEVNSERAISPTAAGGEIRDSDLQQENDEVPELPRRTRRQSHMRLVKGISTKLEKPTLTYLQGTVAYSRDHKMHTHSDNEAVGNVKVA